MAMIARSPVWGSWQNTTCSCPPRAAGEGAGVSWGYAGTLPLGLLTNTFVTVVTLLASSRVLVDADPRQAYSHRLGARASTMVHMKRSRTRWGGAIAGAVVLLAELG